MKKLYPDYTLEAITAENAHRIAECCAHDWSDAGLSELAMYENDHTREVLEDFAAYGCTGYALLTDGEVAAFCIGEVMGDTLIVHIEKGKREYKGAFQMINCLFAKTELEKCGSTIRKPRGRRRRRGAAAGKAIVLPRVHAEKIQARI